MRFVLLFFILGVWELLAALNVIDTFITSSPSIIINTIIELFRENNLIYHIGITLYETILGFIIAVSFGYLIAIILWWSNKLRRILEPYIVVINSFVNHLKLFHLYIFLQSYL